MFNQGNNILGPQYGFIEQTASGDFMQATGGTITTDGRYKIHTFTTNDNFNVLKLGNGLVNIIICGGGGGGGVSSFGVFGGGGASAGEYYANTALLFAALGLYPAVIGAAGIGATANTTDGTNGTSTIFKGITAIGGAGGPGAFGGNGYALGYGSGGSSAGGLGAAGTLANSGGNAAPAQAGGGGGGGAGGSGGSTVLGVGGTRGAGIVNSITGTSLEYCRGGRGGDAIAAALPGINYGSGGDGSILSLSNGGNGAPGVVIIRYQYR